MFCPLTCELFGLYPSTRCRQHPYKGCELRLIRCPFQCGVKILVRNLEKHKRTCSLRHSAVVGRDADTGSDPPDDAKLAPFTETKPEATTPLRTGLPQDEASGASASSRNPPTSISPSSSAPPRTPPAPQAPQAPPTPSSAASQASRTSPAASAASQEPPVPPSVASQAPSVASQAPTLPRNREEGKAARPYAVESSPASNRPGAGRPHGIEGGPASVSGGPGDATRMVTCMRCHESLPFNLVPSHGPKCKGGTINSGGSDHSHRPSCKGSEPALGITAPGMSASVPPSYKPGSSYQGPSVNAISEGATLGGGDGRGGDGGGGGGGDSINAPPPSRATRAGASVSKNRTTPGAGQTPPASSLRQREGLSTTTQPPPPSSFGKGPPPSMPTPGHINAPRGIPLRSRGSVPASSIGPKGWQPGPPARERGRLAPGVGVRRSPPRSKAVRYWGTRQVASWLREVMRPPRADIISRFHDGGIDGAALLELTDRYLAFVGSWEKLNDCVLLCFGLIYGVFSCFCCLLLRSIELYSFGRTTTGVLGVPYHSTVLMQSGDFFSLN